MKVHHFYFIGTNETAPVSMLNNMKSVQFHQFRLNKNGAVSFGSFFKSETVSIGPNLKTKQFHQEIKIETVSLRPYPKTKQFNEFRWTIFELFQSASPYILLVTMNHLTCKFLYKLHLLYYITSHYCYVFKQFHSNLLPPLFACSHTWFTLMVVFVERFNNRQ